MCVTATVEVGCQASPYVLGNVSDKEQQLVRVGAVNTL
jgi:hypothetical protein